MNSESFAYWLQGFVELNGGEMPTREQWKSIVEHLNLVFKKVTPPVFGSQDQKYCNFNAPSFDLPKIDLNEIIVSC